MLEAGGLEFDFQFWLGLGLGKNVKIAFTCRKVLAFRCNLRVEEIKMQISTAAGNIYDDGC